jgi:hypothetical protein
MTSRAIGPFANAAVEGDVDEAVLARLVANVGAQIGTVYGRKGKHHLKQKVTGYNQAAERTPWIVLVDLNDEQSCGPLLKAAWLPSPSQMMCFRVAVREVEAWLMADRERFAAFMGVARVRVPLQPENVDDPKELVVQLARQSSRRIIREDLVPAAGSGRKVGRAYTSRLVEFAQNPWRPDAAANTCDSLNRTLRRLEELLS